MSEVTPQEINEQVARRLGWAQRECHYQAGPLRICWFDGNGDNKGVYPPDFCGDIRAAFEILEGFTGFLLCKTDKGFWVRLHNDHADCFDPATLADTAPMAICKAFLRLGEK